MSLNIDKRHKYANPYFTNWFYLKTLTSLQVELLQKMQWYEASKYIRTDSWAIPDIRSSKTDAKDSVKRFRYFLNEKIKEL